MHHHEIRRYYQKCKQTVSLSTRESHGVQVSEAALPASGADTSTEIPGLSLPGSTEQPKPPTTSTVGNSSSTGAAVSVFIGDDSPDASPLGQSLLSPKRSDAAPSAKPSKASENSSLAANLPMDAVPDKAPPAVKAAHWDSFLTNQAGSPEPTGLEGGCRVLEDWDLRKSLGASRPDRNAVHKLAQAGSMPAAEAAGGEALAAADADDMMYDAFDPSDQYDE